MIFVGRGCARRACGGGRLARAPSAAGEAVLVQGMKDNYYFLRHAVRRAGHNKYARLVIDRVSEAVLPESVAQADRCWAGGMWAGG